MSDDQSEKLADKELEREIRRNRKFSLSEAIGRLAGPGMMKGVSPVPPKQQAEVVIEEYLNRHISYGGGLLSAVLSRQIKTSEQFLANFEQPFAVLVNYVQQVLASEYLLRELVREADMEWGRLYGERPFFEVDSHPPHPDDPITVESVRESLANMLETLRQECRVLE